MLKERASSKLFFGWWIVIVSGILSFWGMGYHAHGISALFKPISSELGFSRAATSVAVGIGRFATGFLSPVTGWLTDKFGPRWVVLFGIFLFSLGLILMNYINSLWAFYVAWGVMVSSGATIAFQIPLAKSISNWFVKKRGVALSVRWMLTGLAGVAVLPLVAWLITIHGWRVTCVIGGLVMLFVGLPLAWFFIRPERPEYYGLLPDGAAVEAELKEDKGRTLDRGANYAAEVQEVEFTLRQAMRTPAYWLLIISFASRTLAFGAVVTHGVPFLTDMGIDSVKAAMIIAMAILTSIPARFVGGFLADRIKKSHLRFLFGGAILLQAIGVTIFRLNPTMVMVYPFFILFWIGTGMSLPLNTAIKVRYFGRKGFGSIQGTSLMFLTPVMVAAPIYAGWIYDTTGSYITAFTTFAALLALAAVVMFLTRPPKPPVEVTDIHKII